MLLALAAILSVASLAQGDDPPACCTDRQFQAVIGRIGGKVYPLTGNTVFIDSYDEMAFDSYRKRSGFARYQRQPDGTVKKSSVLNDYLNKRMYVYEDGVCTITTLDEEMTSHCIPANATFLGSSRLGFGAESLTVNTWETVSDDGLTMKIGVSDRGCVPVLFAYYGRINGESVDVVELFSSFKPGIDNPSDLDLPTFGCTFIGTNDVTTNAPTDAPIVGRR